jgi:L-threonylcarbamoyladenylate synthase
VAGEVCCSHGERGSGRSPGTRYLHYAPAIPVVILDRKGEWKKDPRVEEKGLSLAYMGISAPPLAVLLEIRFGSAEEYAGGLFSALRELERSGAGVILAELPPEEGVGLAVRDRLKRAAGGRKGVTRNS